MYIIKQHITFLGELSLLEFKVFFNHLPCAIVDRLPARPQLEEVELRAAQRTITIQVHRIKDVTQRFPDKQTKCKKVNLVQLIKSQSIFLTKKETDKLKQWEHCGVVVLALDL